MADETLAYPLRVAYDAHAAISKNGGLGKGVQLNNLLGPYRNVFLGLAPAGPPAASYVIRAGFSKYIPWQQISLPRLLRKQEIEIFLAPYNTAPIYIPHNVRLVLVLHDLILMKNFEAPTFYRKLLNQYRKFLVPLAVSRASVVLTVSEFSKREILRLFPKANVEVLPCTIAESWFVGDQYIPIEEREDYVLLVTASASHKNAPRALTAFADCARKFPNRIIRMKIVGLSDVKNSWQNMIASLGIGELVRFEPFLSETDLQNLYRKARAVFVPSLMEGFGIPLLEGMASGTPVISSNTTSLPEVGGDAPRYFDPTDIAEMTGALIGVLSDPELQRDMIRKGTFQAGQFHPRLMLQRVRRFWDQLAETDANAL